MKSQNLFLPFVVILFLVFSGSSAAYEVSPVTNGTAIAGKVTYRGKIPDMKKLLITKDEAVCGKGSVKRMEVSVSPEGALRDVVVVLQGIKKGKPWSVPKDGYVLDQRHCAFRPYLSVIPQKARLLILNSDPVLHNIHTYELIGRARRTLFNVAQPKFKPRVTRTIKTRRGKAIRVECDAHSWMLGWLYVVDSPYYATTGKSGTFSIKDIPAGTYKLKAWHPFLGTVEKEARVPTKGKIELNLEFSQ